MANKLQPIKQKLGLGNAIKRLFFLERKGSNGLSTQDEKAEKILLLEALNNYEIDMNWECDLSGSPFVPDSVNIFKKAVATGCCRRNKSVSRKKKRG